MHANKDKPMNRRDISLAQLGMNDAGPVALIEAAASAGFGSVGLPLRSGALRPLKFEIVDDPAMVTAIERACKATGVGIFDVESLVLGHEPPDDALRRTFEIAARIGASRMSCLGYEPAIGPGRMQDGETAERFAALCAVAAEFDLLIGIEFMLFRSIRTLGDAVSVIEAAGAPNARIILDALHVHRSGATVADVAALPAGIVSHLQLCDAAASAPLPEQLVDEARSERLLPGDGVIPLLGLIAALPAGTPLSLEIPVAANAHLPVAERARRGMASLGWLIAEHTL
ncbi:sugar phosphate isomerase/epimerase family protein [Bosea sp. NBC_00550]|uniref:sugar phosphate isomerase/epimerase family protein n=1 Tax=Bosea sp. NBC_00550 TaxID=2969621 RepID=UPI00222F8905|nr:sugar phosphate isomerase/epimerase [Bosea sp. NBC_00550]UZF94912.1 sugar phosphate isomerase/epimerase [Bosea sp. NBC_00550]